MTLNPPFDRSPGYDDLLSDLKGLAQSLRGFQELDVAQYTPVVENIVATRSRDVRHIGHLLDRLMDFACHPAGLILFKSLGRHYFTIDPGATADYINGYRKIWDLEETEVEP